MRQIRKVMHSLNINGNRITDIKEVIKHEVNFYTDLYSSDNIENDEKSFGCIFLRQRTRMSFIKLGKENS